MSNSKFPFEASEDSELRERSPRRHQFWTPFFLFFSPLSGLPFRSKISINLEKSGTRAACPGLTQMVRKKSVLLYCLRPRKLSPRLSESTISGFWPCAEKAPFGSCFGPSFWSVCELHAQKTRFLWISENCLIFESTFKAFWAPQNRSKVDQNSILGVILGQDGSKEVSS